MTDATRRPWSHRAVAGGWDGIAGPDGEVIARLGINVPENATLIVRAVNAHEALIAALEAAMNYIGNGYQPPELIAQAHAALVLAGVREP